MAAPIVYRWDDSGAPVARGERRSLCDVLYACLVTGYGSKAAAGWTREFVNATFDKAVFRPGAGTRFYLRIDGNTPASAAEDNVQAYESMSDIDTGLFPFNAAQQTMATSTVANTTARPWVLVADDRAFYLVVWTGITATPGNTDYMAATMFFGDIISRYSIDSYACALTSNKSALGNYGVLQHAGTASGGVGSAALAMPRLATGVAGSILPILVGGGGPGSSGSSYPAGGAGLPYSPGDQIFITRPTINEAAANTLRGWMPGLWYPLHNLPLGQLAEVTIAGKTFLSFRHHVGQAYLGNILIDLGEWRV